MYIKDRILEEDLEWMAKSDLDIENCTILITGATGLIGSHIIKSLLYKNKISNSNVKVVALVRNMQKTAEVFADLDEEDKKNIEFICGDITEELNITKNIDYIIHGANATASKYFVTKPVETIETIILGTKNILEFAREKRVKSLVYLSSMEVFGAIRSSEEEIKEEDLGYIDILNVRSSYSEGKRLAETLCASFALEYGVNVKIARLAQTFGPGINKDDNRIFAYIARCVLNNEDIVLHTNGESVGNYCYMRDCIKAILMLLTKGNSGEAYIISNESMSIKDMALMAAEKLAENKISVVFDIPEDSLKHGYAPETKMKLSSKKMQLLGWKAKIGIEESYRRMIKSMEACCND